MCRFAARAGGAADGHPAADYGRLPLHFEPNEGQSDGRVKFLAHGRGYGLFLTTSEAVLSLRDGASGSAGSAFFTTSLAPKDLAVSSLGYQDESNPIPFYVWNTQQSGALPLFRMFNPNLGRHHYTAEVASRDYLISIGMNYESDEGFIYEAMEPGTVELFRLYNQNSGTHLYLTDAPQKDDILRLFPSWVQHTSVGFVFASP